VPNVDAVCCVVRCEQFKQKQTSSAGDRGAYKGAPLRKYSAQCCRQQCQANKQDIEVRRPHVRILCDRNCIAEESRRPKRLKGQGWQCLSTCCDSAR
jgi:hypothetical protein